MKRIACLLLCLPLAGMAGGEWGFYAHRLINYRAVFLLPEPLFGPYKDHIGYLADRAVAPDERRYAVDWEAPRHYIDLDVYGDSALHCMPREWDAAVGKYSEDTLMAYGIVPWAIVQMKHRLTRAMAAGEARQVLLLSAELGHYVGDAHVPLHTTENYNGQLTGQYGIHGFWESRLPELFAEGYDGWLRPAAYIEDPLDKAWQTVAESHAALDSVLGFERALTERMGSDRKFGFETRNGQPVQVYARDFSEAYHRMLEGQVERRLRCAIQCTADFWYTCWIDAGQPDLSHLRTYRPEAAAQAEEEAERAQWKASPPKGRAHDHP